MGVRWRQWSLAGAVTLLGCVLWCAGLTVRWYLARESGDAAYGIMGLAMWVLGSGRTELAGLLGDLGVALIAAAVFMLMVERVLERVRHAESKRETLAEEADRCLQKLRLGGEVAAGAIEDLRASGALREGMLEGAMLREIDLRNQNLGGARLCRADMTGARLNDASLVGAVLDDAVLDHVDVTGADLSWASLAGARVDAEGLRAAKSLWRCKLSDGALYDGRWDLPGDELNAVKYGYDLSRAEDRTKFYVG